MSLAFSGNAGAFIVFETVEVFAFGFADGSSFLKENFFEIKQKQNEEENERSRCFSINCQIDQRLRISGIVFRNDFVQSGIGRRGILEEKKATISCQVRRYSTTDENIKNKHVCVISFFCFAYFVFVWCVF